MDDEELDVAGAVALVLAGEDAVLVGEDVAEAVAEPVAEPVAVDVAVAVASFACAVLVHVGSGVGATVFLPAGSELVLVLVLGSGLGAAVAVVVGVTLGVTLALAVTLGLVLALAEALALAALPSLLWLPLDDVSGAVAVPVALLLAGLFVVAVSAGCVDVDVQGLGEMRAATPDGEDDVPSAVVGAGLLPLPSVLLPGPLEELLLVKAWLMALPTDRNAWRAGGTTDRTTPTANTAAPTAKAGRSMASRQSLRCCRCRAGCCLTGRPSRCRNRPVAKPDMASQSPSAPLGWLARAGRDRIFSRIRSRPSAPGST